MPFTRWIAPILLLAGMALPASALIGLRPCTWVKLDRLNGRIHGQVLDFTHNHGADRRIYSAALDDRRDPPRRQPIRRSSRGLFWALLGWGGGCLVKGGRANPGQSGARVAWRGAGGASGSLPAVTCSTRKRKSTTGPT